MLIAPPVDGGNTVDLDVEDSAASRSVSFQLPPGVAADDGSDSALAAALLPAMRLGEDLELKAAVSSRLLDQTATVQDIFLTWDRDLRPVSPMYHRIAVTAPTRCGRRFPADRGTACFFTGGVDSFYSAIVHREHLDALIYVHGYDVALDDIALRGRITERIREAAEMLRLPLIEVHTDLRQLGEQSGMDWPDFHGAALASVALLLAPDYSRVYLPATNTYAHLESLGSHPLLDPLWSTDDVEIVHDGASATRSDKLLRITAEEAARRHLRVCWENRDGAYNCGRCEKCIRTGVGARIAGIEGRFSSLPSPSLVDVARVEVPGAAATWREYRDELRRTGANPRLKAAVDVALARRRVARMPVARRWLA